MIRVSVVIPAYNAEKTIHNCIQSVLNNRYHNFELIVIDDSSTDNTRKIIENVRDGRIRYFINRFNHGASFSRNYGIKKSTGNLILLLDSDSYVGETWIEKHVKIHQELSADIVGGGVVGIHNTLYGKCDAFCSWWTSIPYSKNYYLKKYHLPANNMSVKKEVFTKIGYFNEDLRLGGEDAEFCFRALKNKLNIYFQSDLIVYHYDRDNLSSFLKHQENWGKHAVKMRRGFKMRHALLMPSSHITACIYIFPLSILFAVFIIVKWIKYKPSVLLYLPVIFIGKIKQMAAIKDSFRRASV